MNATYIYGTRADAVRLMIQIPWIHGVGICGERQGVIAIETPSVAIQALLNHLARKVIATEQDFFAAPSLVINHSPSIHYDEQYWEIG